jgi:hypothetical protein
MTDAEKVNWVDEYMLEEKKGDYLNDGEQR